MSQVRVFSLLGDSNINRHVNKNSCRANPHIKSAQVLPCGNRNIFAETLHKVREATNSCIVSCVTNFISGASGPAAVALRVEPVLREIQAVLLADAEQNSERSYFVAPPMYRTSPVWYREGLPEILGLFSQVFNQDRPPNLHLLPSFPTPDYEDDGIHLTAYSGLEYILHLFDASSELLIRLEAEPEEVAVQGCEATRVLEDRVMVLEQDHRRLNRVVEVKTAEDAEHADFIKNERYEDSFVIYGLPEIPPDVVGKPWQDRAVRDVQAILSILLGREFSIIVVQNATSRARGAEVTYNVKLTSVADSSLIRKTFGSFFLGSQDKRPDALKHVNIKNRVTPETRTRISVLKLLAQRYRDANKGGRAQVISYDPRPMIKITPPASAQDRRTKTYNYVEAVRKLPTNFTPAEVEPILRRINPELCGKIRALFVCLSDDAFRKRLAKFPPHKKDDVVSAGVSDQGGPQGHTEDSMSTEETEETPQPPAKSSKSGTSLKRGASSSSIGKPAKNSK